MATKPPSTEPRSFDELLTEIRSRRDAMSTSHKKLAERVLADPEAVAFMTISELATAVSVNEATVVRFAAGLGLKGYPGLTRLCRERLQEQAQLLRRFDNLEIHEDGDAGLLERAVSLDQANIARTFARIEDGQWDRAIDLLAHSPRVHVLGLRKSHAPAYLLSYLLGMLREDVVGVNAAAGSLTDDLRQVREGDCFVAISIHRYCADTVRAAQWARRRGAHVISLTDNASSPLSVAAHHTFYVDASSAWVLRSMTAFTSLVQAMSGAVATVLGHQVRETLLEEERLLGDFGIYLPDANGRDAR